MSRTSISVSDKIKTLYLAKKAEAVGHLKRNITDDEFMKYMLDAEKWKNK